MTKLAAAVPARSPVPNPAAAPLTPPPFAGPLPPVLDYPPPGVGPAPRPPARPPTPRYTYGPSANAPPPPAPPGPTTRLAQAVVDLLRRAPDAAPAPASTHSGSLRLRGWRQFWPLYLLGLAVTFFVVYQAVQAPLAWAGERWTTVQYGDPRTTHLSALFGFAGEATSPTAITAVNDNGTGHIFVLPGGQAEHAFVLALPLPADPDGRLPLHLVAYDADRDGHPDLLITPGDGATFAYLMDTGKQTFRPPTADEVRRLVLPGSVR